ncbi:S-layer homology domain-containing protein [Candidatus Peregrinibacteria bacterium]|nr:S-layer homology domain-containing protein [Candidatus Peregrinibacteria bacterium]
MKSRKKITRKRKIDAVKITGFAILFLGLILVFGTNAGIFKTSLISVVTKPSTVRCEELKKDWDRIDTAIAASTANWDKDYPAGGYTHRWELENGDLDGHLDEPDACKYYYPDIWLAVAASSSGSSSGSDDTISEARCEAVKADWIDESDGGYTARWVAENGSEDGHLDEPRQCEYLYNEMWHSAPEGSETENSADGFSAELPSKERCDKLKFYWEEGDFTKRFVNKRKSSMDEVGQCIELFYKGMWDRPVNLGRFEDAVFTYFAVSPFPDMNVNNDEGLAAAELQRRKVINGRPDGQFYGSDPVNRAEAAKFLLISRNLDVSEVSNEGRFSDIPEGAWYVKYVITAANLGIIRGDEGKVTFRPADKVNTAEFLKMLSKTFELEDGLDYTYDDVQDGDWFAKYAGAAEKYQLFPKRLKWLAPSNYLSREEVAVAIYNYLANRE